jgi:hypothetical protein
MTMNSTLEISFILFDQLQNFNTKLFAKSKKDNSKTLDFSKIKDKYQNAR